MGVTPFTCSIPRPRPFAPQGEGYLESTAPMYPWHGIWYLVSAKGGQPAPGRVFVGTENLPDKKRALAYVEFSLPLDAGVRDVPVTVYSYSLDRAGTSLCTGTCAVIWPPLLTTSKPQIYSACGQCLAPNDLAVIRRADGTQQVTYRGKPLYLYSGERYVFVDGAVPSSNGAEGNGDGIHGPSGGTFSAVYLGQ